MLVNGTYIAGTESVGCSAEPNVLLGSLLLFFGTYIMSTLLKAVQHTGYFPGKLRRTISDFSVIISLVAMTVLDYNMGVNTLKLNVPDSVEPTLQGRPWLVDFFGSNPWWTVFLAIPPAIFASILIFMDQQITVVIVNRKEHKLKVHFFVAALF